MEFLNEVHGQATDLISHLASGLGREWHPSSMSVNVYDTAWVSMVSKEENESRRWLFPEAFAYILDSQNAKGHWDDEGIGANAILCTMAAVLACLEHRKFSNYTGCEALPEDISEIISKAVTWLTGAFDEWKSEGAVDSVALEILVPALLCQLAEHGISFSSPVLDKMKYKSDKRLSDKTIGALYKGIQITLFHSLEALIGRIDFDKLREHKVRGSMLGSPSSTAAYLMNVTVWDDEAERYLEHALQRSEGKNIGGFPSAAPIDIFEISWTLSTFLECGLSVETLGRNNAVLLAAHLSQALKVSGGVVGFSLEILPDADDTAKSLYTLSFFPELHAETSALISRFCSSDSFKTYEKESTRSISANCNILKALLVTKNLETFAPQIVVAVSFICNAWMEGKPRDKWNTAWEYCAMLSAQCLVQLLKEVKRQAPGFIPTQLQSFQIPAVLAHIACLLLNEQAPDGTFGNGCNEVTAYATLALVTLASPEAELRLIDADMLKAIKTASGVLLNRVGKWIPERIWVEKVTYSSDLLTKAYCIAALNQSINHRSRPHEEHSIAHMQLNKLSSMFGSVPLIAGSDCADILLRVAVQESLPYVAHLEQSRFNIFPKPPKPNEKYLRVIPFAWTLCNYLNGSPLSPSLLLDMIEISLLNYQADEYVELLIPQCTVQEVSYIRDQLNAQISGERSDTDLRSTKRHRGPNNNVSTNSNGVSHSAAQPILEYLNKYIDRILNRPHIREAPLSNQTQVKKELNGYLQAQISSIGARERLGDSSFFEWVHTSGARDTSCPFSFAYYLCLIKHARREWSTGNGDAKHPPISFEADYLLRDLCGSLSRLCRMYNDYGSARRDSEEGNLNSIDFFLHGQGNPTNGPSSSVEEQAKRALFFLANHERDHLDRSFASLSGLLSPGVHADLNVFLDVTDLFGQVYVVQDIGTKTKVR